MSRRPALTLRAEEALDELLRVEDNIALAEWAVEYLEVTSNGEAAERYEEGLEDGKLFVGDEEPDAAENPKLAVAARGYVSRIAWAVCERGDGRALLLGRQEVPIDTREEAEAAGRLAHALSAASHDVKRKLDLAALQRRADAEAEDGA